jgi:hypothetical protein
VGWPPVLMNDLFHFEEERKALYVQFILARALCAMRPEHLFRFGHAFFTHRYITSNRIHVPRCAVLNLRVQRGRYGVTFYLEFSYQLVAVFT